MQGRAIVMKMHAHSCMCTHACAHIHRHTHMCVLTHILAHTLSFTHSHTCMGHTHTYTHSHTHTHTHTYTHTFWSQQLGVQLILGQSDNYAYSSNEIHACNKNWKDTLIILHLMAHYEALHHSAGMLLCVVCVDKLWFEELRLCWYIGWASTFRAAAALDCPGFPGQVAPVT